MDAISIDKLGIREEYERALLYLKWFDVVRDAESGGYAFNPFVGLTYPEYPAFTFMILEAIRSAYVEYLIEKQTALKTS